MALILWLGSDSGSAERTGHLLLPVLAALFPSASPLQLEAMQGLARTLGHVGEYAVLAALWIWALAAGHRITRSNAARWAWAIAVALGLVDEGLQSTIRSRTASVLDVALDATAALGVALPAAVGWRRAVDLVIGVALWIAAAGGALLLAVNHVTGVDSGLLWITVPVAAAALGWRRARRPPRP